MELFLQIRSLKSPIFFSSCTLSYQSKVSKLPQFSNNSPAFYVTTEFKDIQKAQVNYSVDCRLFILQTISAYIYLHDLFENNLLQLSLNIRSSCYTK